MERVKEFENIRIGQTVYGCCELCGSWDAVETHHIFPGRGLRPLSERYGATIRLCHGCHQTDSDSVHNSRETALAVKKYGQKKVMLSEGWSMGEFRAVFGKNYLDPEEIEEIEELQEAREEGFGFEETDEEVFFAL